MLFRSILMTYGAEFYPSHRLSNEEREKGAEYDEHDRYKLKQIEINIQVRMMMNNPMRGASCDWLMVRLLGIIVQTPNNHYNKKSPSTDRYRWCQSTMFFRLRNSCTYGLVILWERIYKLYNLFASHHELPPRFLTIYELSMNSLFFGISNSKKTRNTYFDILDFNNLLKFKHPGDIFHICFKKNEDICHISGREEA